MLIRMSNHKSVRFFQYIRINHVLGIRGWQCVRLAWWDITGE